MNKELLELFRDFGAQTIRQPLFDYGKLYSSPTEYEVIFPSNSDQVQSIVCLARANKIPLRVRASGHTFNGVTLPRDGELLIRTDQFDHFRFDTAGSLTVGSGALVWDVRDLARDHGFDLPVYNGGWAGPTIGGYINSGGFGKSGLSEIYGGVWENVEQITLIDGKANIHSIDRKDTIFPWLFGSYGQLGFLIEAKLKIVPKEKGSNPLYPLGLSGHIPRRQETDPKLNDSPPENGNQPNLFWFSLLVSPHDQFGAWIELYKFVKSNALTPDGGWAGPIIDGHRIGYHYVIPFINFNPPLLYSKPETFLVIGIMCVLPTGDASNNERILQIEKDFIALAVKNRYKLYLQAENIGRNVDFLTYYGEETYNSFRKLKNQFDPDRLLNRDVVFSTKK